MNWQRIGIELIVCMVSLALFWKLPMVWQIVLSVVITVAVDLAIIKYKRYKLIKTINQRKIL